MSDYQKSKFVKKPIIIDAVRFDPEKGIPPGVTAVTDEGGAAFVVDTLEGKMKINRGDWLITGVEGEKYPCKDSIFRATYNPVGGRWKLQPGESLIKPESLSGRAFKLSEGAFEQDDEDDSGEMAVDDGEENASHGFIAGVGWSRTRHLLDGGVKLQEALRGRHRLTRKKIFPFDEIKMQTRLIDRHDLLTIHNGEMDVYPRDTVQWCVNSYQDCDAHILRIPKLLVSDLSVELWMGVISVKWKFGDEAFIRRVALGSRHDPSKIKVMWRQKPVTWSEVDTELWVITGWHEMDKPVNLPIVDEL